MRNKLIIYCFVILANMFCHFIVSANEQFFFDVTEIEISDNGNKFKGFNRGEIKVDNGFKIKANTFEYNKVTNILNTTGDVKIVDNIQNLIIQAEKITYLKNQNIIIAKNKSKIIDKNERIISADNFKYDISKNIFEANGNVIIKDEVQNFILEAGKITYLKNQNIIIAESQAKVIDSDGKIIVAKKITFDIKKNKFKAKGNVKFEDNLEKSTLEAENITYFKNDKKIISKGKTNFLVSSRYEIKSKDIEILSENLIVSSKKKASIKDKKNKNYYQLSNFNINIYNEILKGEKITVISNFNRTYNDKFFFKSGIFDLKNQTFATQNIDIKLKKDLLGNNENDPRIKGVSSSGKSGITTINKGIFTSCKIDDKCTPWSIQAKKIEYDENKKKITYDSALVKIYDTPIFYFPKFFHPGPTVKRQSGFLAPSLGNSQTLGSSIQTPYYWTISDNRDYTFTPTLFDKGVYKFQNEYRQKNKNSSFIADFSLTEGYQSKNSKNKNSVTHLFTEYDSKLNLSSFLDSSLNISIQKVSNDTYLKIFDQNIPNSKVKPENFDTLESKIILNLDHKNYELETGFISYENLQKNNSDRYEMVLPYYNFSKGLIPNENFGLFSFSSLGDNTLKNTNNLRSRVINDLDFKSLDFINKSGFKNNFNFSVKNLLSSHKNDPKYRSNLNNRVMGLFEIQSSFPLIETNKKFVNYLDPKISLRINPSDMINYSNKERRINNDNIFDINRLGLIDTLESGKNLTLGIDFRKEKLEDSNKYFQMKLATVFRDKDNINIPSKSAITKKNSNIFGSIINNFNDNIYLDYEFSINGDLDKIEYHSIGAKFSKKALVTEFQFIEENGVIGNTNIIENKTSYILDKNNSFRFETRQNRKIDLAEYYNLIYEYKNDCLIAGIKYNKTYYSDRDLQPSEELMFNLTLIPITSIGQTVSK